MIDSNYVSTVIMKEDIASDPIDISLFGFAGILFTLNAIADLFQEFFRFWFHFFLHIATYHAFLQHKIYLVPYQ